MDLRLLSYLAVSVLLLVWVYRSQGVIRFNWNDPRNHQDLRPDGTRVLVTNSHAAAMGWLAVQRRPDTAAGNAGLVVLVGWLAGALIGGGLVPAAISGTTEVTSANVAMLLAVGLIWGFIVGRLTITILVLIVGVLLPLAVVAAVGIAIAAFSMGGLDNLERTVGLRGSEARNFWALRTDGDGRRRFDRQMEQNACAVYHTLSSLGDVEGARGKCDKAWVAAQERQRQQKAQGTEESRQQSQALYVAHQALMDKLAEGIQRRIPQGQPVNLPGTWTGASAACSGQMTEFELRLRDGGAGVHDGVLLMRQGRLGEDARYSAFRVRATMDGRRFRLEPGRVIARDAGDPFSADGLVADISLQSMFLTVTSPSCKLRFIGWQRLSRSGS